MVDIVISLFLFALCVGLAWALYEVFSSLKDYKRREIVCCSLLLLLLTAMLCASLSNVFVIEVRVSHRGEPAVSLVPE